MGVGAEEMALLCRHSRAVAVGDASAGFERCRFALQSQLGGFFAVDRPRVKQVQLTRMGLDVGLIGQTGYRVFCGEAGDVVGRLYRALDGRLRKVGRAGVAAAVAHIHRHAQRFVAVALHVLQFALSHRDGQTAALGGFGAGIGGAELFGMRQGAVDEVFKKLAAVAETAVG